MIGAHSLGKMQSTRRCTSLGFSFSRLGESVVQCPSWCPSPHLYTTALVGLNYGRTANRRGVARLANATRSSSMRASAQGSAEDTPPTLPAILRHNNNDIRSRIARLGGVTARILDSTNGDWGRRLSRSSPYRNLATTAVRTPVERGVVSPWRNVPDHVPKTPYYHHGMVPGQENCIYLHTSKTIGPMREACILARRVLELCCTMAKPGITTDDIDAMAHQAIIEAGACPSPLNYRGFPKSICASVNEVACHAIPDDRPLQEGDIVSFDVSVYYKGFHGDNCATVGVGQVDSDGQRLIDVTRAAMMEGVSVCRPGGCLTEVGSAIHAVADRHGFQTVTKYCGHGVGASFHMLPHVQHFRNTDHLELTPGMTFTIEPIFTEGSEATRTLSDGWTVETKDAGRAAQFEHVVLITDEGCDILTVIPPE